MKPIITSLLLGTASIFMFSACGDKEKKGTGTDSSSGGLGTGYEGEDAVVLKPDLPKEKIEGSPAPKNIPGLIPRPKKFPEFKIPEGAVIVSKGKKVTSSCDLPILGELSQITDGEKEADEGYFVELDDFKQWVQIDLEKSVPLYAIIVWHYHADKRVFHDVVVQVSDDPEFKDGGSILYNNDYDDSSGFGKGKDRPYIESRYGLLLDGQAKKARYVRLYSKGSTAGDTNQYIEVEVYGKPE